jgi:hypothetical protein
LAGILYCVGTVEISPQRIEMLLVCAQVLGIPTLISFLKRIRQSIAAGKISKEPPPIPTPPPPPSLAVGVQFLEMTFVEMKVRVSDY